MKPNLNEFLTTPEYNVNYRTNSIGLRDDEELIKKRENEKRIIVIGDSFIHAAQVDEKNTMCQKLEKMLNSTQPINRNNKEINVINTGKSGWTPTDEREFLENNYQLLEPDIVLLFVYVGNDFSETIRHQNKININNKEKNKSIIIRFLKKSKTLMIDHSKLFTFVYKQLTQKKWPMGRPNQPFHNPETNVFNTEYNSQIKMAYQIVETELLKIQDICKKNGSNFHLFIIPTKEQIDESKLQETVDFLKLDMNQINLTKPQKILSEFAKKNNIKMFDLLTTLKEAGANQPVYYEIDSHWNVFGNSIVAKVVCNYLSNNN